MTDEVYEYQQSMQELVRAAHLTQISPTCIASEAENHKKDGPCQTIVLPNLPSVAGRVKYAMGTMNLRQFSQRTGISGSYLGQLCNGKAKTLSAYNANRIAGASSMGVTVGWLLGLPKTEEKQPPTPPPEPEQPSRFMETARQDVLVLTPLSLIRRVRRDTISMASRDFGNTHLSSCVTSLTPLRSNHLYASL